MPVRSFPGCRRISSQNVRDIRAVEKQAVGMEDRALHTGRPAGFAYSVADKLERLAGYFDGRTGELEEALWHLVTQYRE